MYKTSIIVIRDILSKDKKIILYHKNKSEA